MVQYASLEYITAVIYHEAIHGYLNAINQHGNDANHETMATSLYLTKMVSSINKIYPATIVDLNALKWFGLMRTDAFADGPSEIEKGIIRNKVESYRTGTGLSCR